MLMYIPPQGLYFRLTGQESQHVLYSRRGPSPELWHYKGGQYEDQLFTLIHGTGSRAGLYAIKGKHSGKVLYSRTSPEPCVGHVDGDGKYNDKYAVSSCVLSLMLTHCLPAGSTSKWESVHTRGISASCALRRVKFFSHARRQTQNSGTTPGQSSVLISTSVWALRTWSLRGSSMMSRAARSSG